MHKLMSRHDLVTSSKQFHPKNNVLVCTYNHATTCLKFFQFNILTPPCYILCNVFHFGPLLYDNYAPDCEDLTGPFVIYIF